MANVGSADLIARLILGAGLLAGAVMLVTAVVGVCPAYRLPGINTCRIGRP